MDAFCGRDTTRRKDFAVKRRNSATAAGHDFRTNGGMITKPVSAKMGIKAASRAILLHAPAEAVEAIDLPELTLASRLTGSFDYIHYFVTTQAALDGKFAQLREHLKPTGMLWVSWPKGRKNGTDLTLTTVIKIGYDHGLVESKALSIDETWSGLKFTHPKAGKVYKNRFGKLATVGR
jgi:hypothetical protein